MTAALEGGEWSAARPGRTLPPEKTRYPFYRRLGGPQGRSGRAENLVRTGIRSRTVQPVVSRYTDWATMPTSFNGRSQLKCDGTRAETRFCLSTKRTSPFKSAGASVQSTTGSRGVRISGSNVGYTMFRGSVKGTGYPLHSPVSRSLPLLCVTVCHHISTGPYASENMMSTSLSSWQWTLVHCLSR